MGMYCTCMHLVSAYILLILYIVNYCKPSAFSSYLKLQNLVSV